MKKLFIILLTMVFSTGLFATEPETDGLRAVPVILKGVVSDRISGEVLAGVKVKVEGSDNVSYTDFDGKFEISDLSPGKYTLVVEYISYDSKKIEKIDLGSAASDEELAVKLTPSTVAVSN